MEKEEQKQFNLESDSQFTRIATNFFQNRTQGEYSANDVAVVKEFFYHTLKSKALKKYKVALCFICLNQPYWEFIAKAIEGAKKFFLPDHQVDYFIWSDLPVEETKKYEATIFPTEATQWPMPTLFRYHLFLQQEEKLQEYDYIFYCDIDMVFVNYVGDEILGEGLTAALHPMYDLRHSYVAPYESNPESAAYIKRSGKIIYDNGRPRFKPTYFAGGFQGGKTKEWIEAMKEMRKMIDYDFEKNNFIPIWNDESVWNKYLFNNPPDIVLSPAYIYPDSLINEYYVPLWGRNYSPKIITLTKKFSVSKEGGEAVREQLKTINPKV